MTYRLPHPEAKPPKLDPKEVPEAFRHLAPTAGARRHTPGARRNALGNDVNQGGTSPWMHTAQAHGGRRRASSRYRRRVLVTGRVTGTCRPPSRGGGGTGMADPEQTKNVITLNLLAVNGLKSPCRLRARLLKERELPLTPREFVEGLSA